SWVAPAFTCPEIDPLFGIRLVEGNNPHCGWQRTLHMQRASLTCPAQDKAARAVFVFGIYLDDGSIDNGFHDLCLSYHSLNASLNSMLPPIVYSVPELFLDSLHIHLSWVPLPPALLQPV